MSLPSSHKSLFQGSCRAPKWSSHRLHWELAQTLHMAKGFKCFLPCIGSIFPLWPHEHHCTLLPAFLSTKTSTAHWSGKHTPGFFFSSWQSCLFPAVVKSDFSSDCHSAADIYLIWGRKITYFSPPCSLIGTTCWVLLLLCHPEKDLKGGRTDSTPSTPNKGSKCWQWYCKQDYTQRWGEKSSPEVGTGCNLIYLQILVQEERSWWYFVF